MFQTIAAYLPENNRLERIWKLAQVDFKSRYYNDRLGLLWALIKPIFEVTVYFVIFKQVFNVQQENFALFLFSGIITWMIFAEATSRGMLLLSQKLYLIENIQLKRIDLYLSYILSVFFSYIFNLSAFLLVSLLTGNTLNANVLYLPILLLTVFVLSLGVSLILSCVQPFIKDLHHAWDMVLLVGFWVSGIFFEHSMLTDKIPWLYYANPFIGIIHNIHGATLGSSAIDVFIMWYDLLYAFAILGVGLWVSKVWGGLAVEKL